MTINQSTTQQRSRMMTIPPRQQPHALAVEIGFMILRTTGPSASKLAALGASSRQGKILLPTLSHMLTIDLARRNRHHPRTLLPTLSHMLTIDLAQREICVEGEGAARQDWAALAMHYLCAIDTRVDAREVTLNDFADSRGYMTVFEKRIISRFLATVGRSEAQYLALGQQYGVERAIHSGTAFTFSIFPRLPITLVRYEGDEEFPPNATVLYQADAGHLLPAEDRIIAAGLLLDMLSGKPLAESVTQESRPA